MCIFCLPNVANAKLIHQKEADGKNGSQVYSSVCLLGKRDEKTDPRSSGK